MANAIREDKQAVEAHHQIIDNASIPELVEYLAPKYGCNASEVKRIVFLESSNNPNAVHDGGLGKGATGFHKKTFEGWAKQFNMELNYESNFDQLKLMCIAFTKGDSYKDDWTTWTRFYSSK